MATQFQDGTSITMEVMGCQVHAIIRPLLADPVTYDVWLLSEIRQLAVIFKIKSFQTVLGFTMVLRIPQL